MTTNRSKNELFIAHCYDSNIDYNIIKQFIENNTDINLINILNEALIIISTFGKNLHIIKYLVRKGANIHTIKDNGTLLNRMCILNKSKYIKYLIKKDVRLTRNFTWSNELCSLCIYGNLSMIKLFFKHFKNDIIKYYINKFIVIDKSSNISSMLLYTCSCKLNYNSYKIMEILLNHNIDINIHYNHNDLIDNKPLYQASINNNLNLVKLLLNNNYKIHEKEYKEIINNQNINKNIKYEIEKSYMYDNII